MDLDGLVRPVVEGAGLDLIEVRFTREEGRRVLRVTVDRPGGIDLDTIAQASGRISRRLDLEGFDPPGGSYALEVSSPGVERNLRDPLEFARHVGEKVKVKTARPVEGVRTLTGTIVEAGTGHVRIFTDAGERTVPYDDIASARTVFEWGRSGRAPAGRTTEHRQVNRDTNEEV